MKVIVLASGSQGNSTYIETETTKSLIDLGMSNLYIEKHLKEKNIDPDSIQSVFITHTHTDHIAGLRVFIKKHHPVVYLTKKMYDELKDIIEEFIIIDSDIIIGDLTVRYFKTSHDASDSVGYVFTSIDKSLVYVTDTGYINQKNYELLKNRNIYIFESNHDIKMLMDNPNYPYNTKQRILSDKGHLSNKDCAYYLSQFVGKNTKTVVLAHLSEQNNIPSLALKNLKESLDINISILIAEQNESTELIEV